MSVPTDLEYSVTESVHRNRANHVVKIEYEFEELAYSEAPIATSSTSITKQSRERRSRSYNAAVSRAQYLQIARQLPHALSYEHFITVLRPFIMGFYASGELEIAFHALDRDNSGTIHIDELSVFLPILNDNISDSALRNYIRKVDQNFDGNMNYEEFRALVLRGIGRDIICNRL